MMPVALHIKYFIYRIMAFFTAKKHAIIRRHIGLSQTNTIAILFSTDGMEKYALLQELLKALQSLGKKVSILGYVSTIDQIYPLQRSIHWFNHHDFTYWGKSNSQVIQWFQRMPFDYLLHIDLVSNPLLDCIIAKSQAKCRVGHFEPYRSYLFEVMVKIERKTQLEDNRRLIDQMLYYINCMEH